MQDWYCSYALITISVSNILFHAPFFFSFFFRFIMDLHLGLGTWGKNCWHFVLSELWLDWVRDEQKICTTKEERNFIISLFDKAVKDYTSKYFSIFIAWNCDLGFFFFYFFYLFIYLFIYLLIIIIFFLYKEQTFIRMYGTVGGGGVSDRLE